jgi:hypothetical protein
MMTDDRLIQYPHEEEEKKPRKRLRLSIAPFLTLFFILLKLTGLVEWSWWWVFSPLWIPVGAILLGVISILIITCGFIIYRLINKKI